MLNSPHIIKLFDTKIDCFGGRNRLQQHLSLSIVRIQRSLSLSLLSNQGLKNNKNKLYSTKIKLKNIKGPNMYNWQSLRTNSNFLCKLGNNNLFVASFLL